MRANRKFFCCAKSVLITDRTIYSAVPFFLVDTDISNRQHIIAMLHVIYPKNKFPFSLSSVHAVIKTSVTSHLVTMIFTLLGNRPDSKPLSLESNLKDPIDHFTVVCSVTWCLNNSYAGGDLVLIHFDAFVVSIKLLLVGI